MTNIAQALVQLKAFARQDGAILWLLWTASFIGLIVDPTASWGSLFAFLTPFMVGWRLVKFRDEALDGVISFRRGYAYCWYVFFYGALLFAIEQYLYFRYLDNGTFATLLMQTSKTLEEVYKAEGLGIAEIKEAMDVMSKLKPIQFAFLFLMQNILTGTILSLPIAAICARRANVSNRFNQ